MIFPNPLRAAGSAFRAFWWKLRGRKLVVPKEVQQDRNLECRFCEEYVNGQCRVCTCFTELKTALAHEKCPKKKWTVYISNS